MQVLFLNPPTNPIDLMCQIGAGVAATQKAIHCGDVAEIPMKLEIIDGTQDDVRKLQNKGWRFK